MCETQSSAAADPTRPDYAHLSNLIHAFAIFSMEQTPHHTRACLLYRRADSRDAFLVDFTRAAVADNHIESLLGGEPALGAIDNKSSRRRRHTHAASG
jgi:hypothetical protein